MEEIIVNLRLHTVSLDALKGILTNFSASTEKKQFPYALDQSILESILSASKNQLNEQSNSSDGIIIVNKKISNYLVAVISYSTDSNSKTHTFIFSSYKLMYKLVSYLYIYHSDLPSR